MVKTLSHAPRIAAGAPTAVFLAETCHQMLGVTVDCVELLL
jgi:hypothetical protein